MFTPASFEGLKDASEVKAAVQYLAKNEFNFTQQLAIEGLDYDTIQAEIKRVWVALLETCSKFKFSDYIVKSKKIIYGIR